MQVILSNGEVFRHTILTRSTFWPFLFALMLWIATWMGIDIARFEGTSPVLNQWGNTLIILIGSILTALILSLTIKFEYINKRGKFVRCSECGEVRDLGDISKEQSKRRCGECYHEVC